MKTRHILLLAAVWVMSILGTVLWAQSGPPEKKARLWFGDIGPIITGDNIGFQRVGPGTSPPMTDAKITGKLMVKIEGQWYEVAAITAVR